jgi:hypothetical protein
MVQCLVYLVPFFFDSFLSMAEAQKSPILCGRGLGCLEAKFQIQLLGLLHTC